MTKAERNRLYYLNNQEKIKAYRLKNRLKRAKQAKDWRERNKEWVREYFQQRYPEAQAKRFLLTFQGRRCKLCDIPLWHPVYGAKRTVVYCYTCSQDKRSQYRLNMVKYRNDPRRISQANQKTPIQAIRGSYQ